MSGRLIGYPSGWTLAVVDDPAEAERAERELIASGVAEDDVVVLAGPAAAERMTRLGASSGPVARVRRAMQFVAMDQLPDLAVYELAIREGRAVVGMRIGRLEARRTAIDLVRRHGGHFINRFGAWATEEIAPWRGPAPEVPQLMRR